MLSFHFKRGEPLFELLRNLAPAAPTLAQGCVSSMRAARRTGRSKRAALAAPRRFADARATLLVIPRATTHITKT
ncbi:hypothetical protein [Paraburkholderia lacunae]|uniref:Uncharacterized protein n=1 Tax=Paraburkholderia lacunae TaxID=2211104 RepID=A0A370N2S5_9BURK|nr:hypothetical protein [Paraburkholderia lacunae]RDJ99900.1 hypothetical protein DLM46_26015 [Paraburkholderia lacunae]